MPLARAFAATYSPTLENITAVNVSSRYATVPSSRQACKTIFDELKLKTLWNLQAIGTYKAHELSTGAAVNIAIIDTGIDYNHSQLKERFSKQKGYDFVRNAQDPMDKEGHGTHVAGTACSTDYGVSLDSTLHALRTLDEHGSGRESDIIAAIEWCVQNNMDVANLSLGSESASSAFEEMCAIAYQRGLVLVAAAGNEGYGPSYPAAFGDSVISVAAVDQANQHPSFSNIWRDNDISAPGVDILSTYLGGGYAILSGTSMATPHVTGAVALALSITKKDPDALDELIGESARQLESDTGYDTSWVFGAGLIQADQLLAKLMASTVSPGFRSAK